MPNTIEQIVMEAQQLSPQERRRLIVTLAASLTSRAEEPPNTARSRLYQPAARLIGGFRDRADATNLAANHDDSLDESFRFDRLAMSPVRASQQTGIHYNSDSPAGRAPDACDIRPNLA